MEFSAGNRIELDELVRVPKQEWQPCYCEHGHAIGLSCDECIEKSAQARKRPVGEDHTQGLVKSGKKSSSKRTKRALCAHERTLELCKPCGGASVCVHGRRKTLCEACGGASICEHHIERAKCKRCGGVSVCVHGKMKAVCKLCDGVSLCAHGKQKCRCKLCGGSSFCEHGKRKSACKMCGGSEFCSHGKRKSTCKTCGGSAFCEHSKRSSDCAICKSKRPLKPPRQTIINNVPYVPFPPSLLVPVTSTRRQFSGNTTSTTFTLQHHQFLLSPSQERLLWDQDEREEFPVLPLISEETGWTQPPLPSISPLVLARDSPLAEFKL